MNDHDREVVGWELRTEWGAVLRFAELEDAEVLRRALLLGASDMHQVIAACDAYGRSDDVHLDRALETAAVVCYCRAFSQSYFRRLDATFAPIEGSPERKLHDSLMTLRHKVYAHTDDAGVRAITAHTIDTHGDVTRVGYSETYRPLEMDRISALAADRKSAFGLEASRIAVALSKAQGSPAS